MHGTSTSNSPVIIYVHIILGCECFCVLLQPRFSWPCAVVQCYFNDDFAFFHHLSHTSLRWAYFWQLPFTARGKAGEPLTLGDTMHVFRTNIEQVDTIRSQERERERERETQSMREPSVTFSNTSCVPVVCYFISLLCLNDINPTILNLHFNDIALLSLGDVHFHRFTATTPQLTGPLWLKAI